MKPTHTPGPWTTQPTTRAGNGSDWLDILAHDGPFPGRYIGECTKKDAALICAAPELLQALRGMLAVWPYMECNETRAARAAVDRATAV